VTTQRPATLEHLDTSTPVLVLSAKTHGSLGIIRSLGRLGVPVFAIDAEPRGPAAESRYLRRRFVFDLGDAESADLVEVLLRASEAIGRRAVLIPTWDETAVAVSEIIDLLDDAFLVPRQPDELPGALTDKAEMSRLARRHDVPTPEIVVPQQLDDVRAFAGSATFPVMLKGIDGNRLKARTGRKMVLVDGPAELLRLYSELEDPDDPNLMLQEYIPGGDDTVWMFNGYFDERSDCLVGFTGRKLRQTPIYTGATSLGICTRNDVINQTTRRWMKAIGYRGILDIGYRYDARDGQYKVLDVNPRIGATFRLFVASNGMDVARALYLDLTGQPVPVALPIEGRKWMVEMDIKSSLDYWRDGKLGPAQWLQSLSGIQEFGYFARDDLRPFLSLVRNLVPRRPRRARFAAALMEVEALPR
jgi:D-aspartate ligase